MSEIHFIKMPGGVLRPANQSDQDAVNKVRNGTLVVAEVKQPRNAAFHRKYFALLNLGFDYWEPEPIQIEGIEIVPEKNFDRFRKDVQILAGYRTLVVNLKNEVRYESQSISFGKMDEIEFNKLYESVYNLLWRMVLSKVKGMTPEVVESTMNQLLSFD